MNKTLAKSINILNYLSDTIEGKTISEISTELDIPKSSVADILSTLEKFDYISKKNLNNKKYTIGFNLLRLANKFYSTYGNASILLNDLKNRCHATILYSIREKDCVCYILKFEYNTLKINTPEIGERNELYYSGTGKAILAAESEIFIRQYMERVKFSPRTKNTIITKEALYKEIENIRKNGYSVDNEEGCEGIYCIACPIYDYRNEVIGAINIIKNIEEKEEGKDKKNIKQLTETALKISKLFGYSKDYLY
ncbi:IclR family transcriptional regulator [Cetobacterium sp.]|uniref:IclR family transcriptional regulator n=1 Tax=Cetobacterium sp. TaxID=2071632 RepID=UPI002FC9ED75